MGGYASGMPRFTIPVLVLLAGCDFKGQGGWGRDDPTEVGTSRGNEVRPTTTGLFTTSTTTNTFYTGPVLVEMMAVGCTVGDVVRFEVQTVGWTSGGRFFSQETGVAGTAAVQWSEEHDVASYEFDNLGAWDHLDRELVTGQGPKTWSVNQSTVFTCADHFEATGVMSYATVVYDLDGNMADCLAFGHDPQGMIDGVYPRANEPGASLDTCIIVVTR